MEIVLADKTYEIVVKRNALDSVGEWIASLWKNKKSRLSVMKMSSRYTEKRSSNN